MSFDPRFDRRWESIFRPAIESITVGGRQLKSVRVDIRKSGDSILSEINDGIAHSQVVLADIAVVDRASQHGTTTAFRNGNVMFEVGIALACRQPVEVVLVRDDTEKLLFDISHIPVLRFEPLAWPSILFCSQQVFDIHPVHEPAIGFAEDNDRDYRRYHATYHFTLNETPLRT